MISKRLGILTLLLLLIFCGQSFSQFGKNKVHYRTFEWKYIETTHFDIYYYDDAKELAEFTAINGETALKSIEKTLNYTLAKRIPIIIYNSKNEFQQTNIIDAYLPEGIGGVTELYKNRVVLPFLGNLAQFKHVIHHELSHAVLNDMFYGGNIQTALNTGNVTEIPLWMNEGFAEWESIGGIDPNTDMFMRDVVLSENLVELRRLDGYYAYRGGQSFYWYVADKYGEQRVGELINRLRVTGNVDFAFKSTFQENLEEFSEEWQKAMKKYFMPDIAKYKDPDEFSIRITNAKKERSYYNSSPSISPNGKKLAYISAKEGFFSIYVQDMDKKENVTKLVSSLRRQDFEELNILTPGISWNPDGTKLAISAKAGGDDAIFIVEVKSGDYDKIKLGLKSITSVTWSPKGDELAFIASGPKGSDLFIYNLKTRHTQNLTDDLFSDFSPVWSWDATKIYFISDRGDNIDSKNRVKDSKILGFDINQSDIFCFNLKNKEITRITNDPVYNKTSLVVSSDNNRLLFVSDKSGISNIYKLDLGTGKILPVTNSLTAISQLSITPDGRDLLYATFINGGSDIYHIRDPFDKKIDSDSLPLTKFRENTLNKKSLKDDFAKSLQQDSLTNKKQKLTGYGNFEVELTRQQIIKPNPDALKNAQIEKPDTVNLSASTIFPEKDYKISFSPDMIMTNPSVNTFYGYQGLAQVVFSDVMGNHQLYFAAGLWVDLKNSIFYGSYSYNAGIINYQVSAYHNALTFYGNNNYLYRFRNYGIGLNASYPFDLFTRLEWGVSWINLAKEYVDEPIPSDTRMLFVPQVKYVFDNALGSSFSPTIGTRYFVNVKGSPKIVSNGLSFLNVDVDFREYYTIFNWITFAGRFAGGGSFGPNPQKYFLGGTENWFNAEFKGGYMPFDKPEDFVFDQIIMPLRGNPVNALNGDKYFLTNLEMRFPLFQALVAGPLPVLFQGVMGSLFMDMGGAWYGPLNSFKSSTVDEFGNMIPNDLLMALGVGIRSFVFGIPMKLDIAWRNEFSNWSQPYYMFSIGVDF